MFKNCYGGTCVIGTPAFASGSAYHTVRLHPCAVHPRVSLLLLSPFVPLCGLQLPFSLFVFATLPL